MRRGEAVTGRDSRVANSRLDCGLRACLFAEMNHRGRSGSWRTLLQVAEVEVEALLSALPDDVGTLSRQVPVVFEGRPHPGLVADGLDDGILGLFVGLPYHLGAAGIQPEVPVQIQLFLENLWTFSGQDLQCFREEVRRTLLHELGHYLGLDEDDLVNRELD